MVYWMHHPSFGIFIHKFSSDIFTKYIFKGRLRGKDTYAFFLYIGLDVVIFWA